MGGERRFTVQHTTTNEGTTLEAWCWRCNTDHSLSVEIKLNDDQRAFVDEVDFRVRSKTPLFPCDDPVKWPLMFLDLQRGAAVLLRRGGSASPSTHGKPAIAQYGRDADRTSKITLVRSRAWRIASGASANPGKSSLSRSTVCRHFGVFGAQTVFWLPNIPVSLTAPKGAWFRPSLWERSIPGLRFVQRIPCGSSPWSARPRQDARHLARRSA